MRKADNGLRKIFRDHLRNGIFWTTIETGATAGGVPDSNYLTVDGVEGWVEFKATSGFAVKFESAQIGWHLRRARYGGRSWIAIRRQHEGGVRRGDAVDELYLCPGCYVVELEQDGLLGLGKRLRPVGAGGPAAWRWPVVRALLAGVIVPHG